MATLTGALTSVDEEFAGGKLRDDHTAGARVLRLGSATDFGAGSTGKCSIRGVVYTYTSTDPEDGVLYLDDDRPGLDEDTEADVEVRVHPPSPTIMATVQLDGQTDDPIFVPVGADLVPQTPLGVREIPETVTVNDNSGDWMLGNIVGEPSQVPTFGDIVDQEQFDVLEANLAAAQVELDAAQANLNEAFPTGAFPVAPAIDAAYTLAENAQQDAGTAVSTANSAVALANGINKRYSSTSVAPSSGAGYKVGDIWEQSSGGTIIKRWELAGNFVWVVKVYGDATLGNVDASKVTAVDSTFQQSVIDKLVVQLANLIKANIGDLTVTGDARMSTLVAQAIASQTGEFLELFANQIIGGDITALVRIVAGGELLVGSLDSIHVRITNGAIRVYLPAVLDESGVLGDPIEIASFGGVDGTTTATIDPSTGETIASQNSDGSWTAKLIDAEQIQLNGIDIGELFAPTFAQVARGAYPTTAGPYSTKTGVFALGFTCEPSMGYTLELNCQSRGENYHFMGMTVEYGTSKAATLAPRITSTEPNVPAQYETTGTLFQTRDTTFEFQTPSTAQYCRVLFYIKPRPAAGRTVDSRYHRFLIRKNGPVLPSTGQPSLGGASGTTPPPAEPDAFEQIHSFQVGSHQNWYNAGKYGNAYLLHGQSANGNEQFRSYMAMSPAMLAQAARAVTLSEVRLYLKCFSGERNTDIYVGTIRTTNVSGGTEPTVYDVTKMTSMSPGSSRNLRLPAAHRNDIKSGVAKGVFVGRFNGGALVRIGSPSDTRDEYHPYMTMIGTE